MNAAHFRRPTPRGQRATNTQGFTLVEVLVATTLCLVVIGMAMPAFVSGLTLSAKSIATTKVTDGLRLSAEHMSAQIALSTREPVLSNMNSEGTGAARFTYRTMLGLPGQALATAASSNTLKVAVDGTCYPKVGDLVFVSGLNGEDGLIVTAVEDTRTAKSASQNSVVTLTFASSFQTATATTTDILAGQSVSIFRDSAYQVIKENGENQLAWYRHASDAEPTQIIARLAASSAEPFKLVDGQLNFNFDAENTGNAPTGSGTGKRSAYTRAGLKGQLMSKSGNPFALITTPAKTEETITSYPRDSGSSDDISTDTLASTTTSTGSSTPATVSTTPAKTTTTTASSNSSNTTTAQKEKDNTAADF